MPRGTLDVGHVRRIRAWRCLEPLISAKKVRKAEEWRGVVQVERLDERLNANGEIEREEAKRSGEARGESGGALGLGRE